ncbi:uncharacterized protein LOC128988059 [Macrosteles quadrilineatus]|uniref:uncharacterized protein LOC128988059 n=1 Tax=Macrosteles quadrilineatus TaxID=74068 RepID=UPI0023E2E875|nr:uncharacterized protein LOC128988059 [Macrosteles quadrilineatus]
MDGHRITLQFLQDIVSEMDPDVTVSSFEVSHAAGRGDNYTSTLYRVLVCGSKDTEVWSRSLIYKQLPDSLAHRELYRSDVLFLNEVSFYKEALTALLQFQSCTGGSQSFTVVPKCFLAHNDVLVLEDLRERGFVMGNRQEGLDYLHCVAVFREIGRFHALSLAMKSKEPTLFQEQVASKIRETFFTDQNEEYYHDYYCTLIKNALAMVDAGLENTEKLTYLNKLKKFLDEKTFFKTMTTFAQPKEPLAVLTHGDFWTNNIMFRYSDSGEIEEVCFVDFQCARYGSPALDLVNFLYSCVDSDVRTAHSSDLMAQYCSAVSTSLTSMGCDSCSAPYCDEGSLPQLIQQEVERHSLYGLGVALDMIPISTCDSALAPDLYEAEGEEHESVTPFCSQYNPECQRRMTQLVKELVDLGYL